MFYHLWLEFEWNKITFSSVYINGWYFKLYKTIDAFKYWLLNLIQFLTMVILPSLGRIRLKTVLISLLNTGAALEWGTLK